MRRPLKVSVLLAIVALATIVGYRIWKAKPTVEVAASPAQGAIETANPLQSYQDALSTEPPVEVPQETTPAIETPAAPAQVETANRSSPGSVPITQTPRGEATPHTRSLVAALTQLPTAGATLTPEQSEQWKQAFQQLIQQGDNAVPAIREFLEQNRDVTLGSENALGYSSLRAAFFDALQQIGGSEAQGLMLQVLQSTAVPSEIARLARYLEQQAPGQFRDQISVAACETLAQAGAGQLRGWDVGPLFQTLSAYRDSSTAVELERDAAKWNYYSTLALANLQSGEGIPSLIRLAQESSGSGSRGAALEALAQVAVQYPDATAAMVELARSGKISDRYWLTAAAALGGDRSFIRDSGFDTTLPVGSGVRTYHLEASNQNFYTIPAWGGMSNEQISERVAIIDQLLAVSASPAVAQALQKARASLLNAGQQASSN